MKRKGASEWSGKGAAKVFFETVGLTAIIGSMHEVKRQKQETEELKTLLMDVARRQHVDIIKCPQCNKYINRKELKQCGVRECSGWLCHRYCKAQNECVKHCYRLFCSKHTGKHDPCVYCGKCITSYHPSCEFPGCNLKSCNKIKTITIPLWDTERTFYLCRKHIHSTGEDFQRAFEESKLK